MRVLAIEDDLFSGELLEHALTEYGYDALTTKRVYKEAFSHQTAKATVLSRSGEQFDPNVVDAFLAREQEFIEVLHRFAALPPDSPHGSDIRPQLAWNSV